MGGSVPDRDYGLRACHSAEHIYATLDLMYALSKDGFADEGLRALEYRIRDRWGLPRLQAAS